MTAAGRSDIRPMKISFSAVLHRSMANLTARFIMRDQWCHMAHEAPPLTWRQSNIAWELRKLGRNGELNWREVARRMGDGVTEYRLKKHFLGQQFVRKRPDQKDWVPAHVLSERDRAYSYQQPLTA